VSQGGVIFSPTFPTGMSKAPSPLLGYNNNVRHKNKVFHIQTEDSGVRYGHIITHLFTDGGRILKSVKTSYSEYLANEKMADIVREMMKQQHKAMFIALRDGKFDHLLFPGKVPPPPAEAPAPTKAKTPPPPPPKAKTPAPPPPKKPSVKPAPTEEEAPPTQRTPPEELTLDIDALERAAAAAETSSPVMRMPSDLPPPPTNLFREKTATGKYKTITPAPVAAPAPPPAKKDERRYAATRPASIFGQARPQQGKTIFGEDLISDKSLDEVILSYLADDLDPSSDKK
jgi:hypothetical protein